MMLKNVTRVVLSLLILLAGPALAQDLDPDHPYHTRDDRLLVIAHRGGSHLRPENTLLAFRHAAELNVDVLELDVRSTADGVLVVIHDAMVDRTTDGTGAVHSHTFEELQQLDAAFHWVAATDKAEVRYSYRGEGVRIPALEEVLAAFPEMVFSIEIKQVEPPIAQPLCDMLHQRAMIDQVVVNAANPNALSEFRTVCPDAYLAVGIGELHHQLLLVLSDVLSPERLPVSVFQIPRAHGLPIVTPITVRSAHSAGFSLVVWTINDRDTMQRLIAMNVDGIITDRPDLLLELLGRLN